MTAQEVKNFIIEQFDDALFPIDIVNLETFSELQDTKLSVIREGLELANNEMKGPDYPPLDEKYLNKWFYNPNNDVAIKIVSSELYPEGYIVSRFIDFLSDGYIKRWSEALVIKQTRSSIYLGAYNFLRDFDKMIEIGDLIEEILKEESEHYNRVEAEINNRLEKKKNDHQC